MSTKGLCLYIYVDIMVSWYVDKGLCLHMCRYNDACGPKSHPQYADGETEGISNVHLLYFTVHVSVRCFRRDPECSTDVIFYHSNKYTIHVSRKVWVPHTSYMCIYTSVKTGSSQMDAKFEPPTHSGGMEVQKYQVTMCWLVDSWPSLTPVWTVHTHVDMRWCGVLMMCRVIPNRHRDDQKVS